jgi:hypothetical protein
VAPVAQGVHIAHEQAYPGPGDAAHATGDFMVTGSSDRRRGLSWLNKTPLQALLRQAHGSSRSSRHGEPE